MKAKLNSYDVEEHRHRFAVWAAARATQRGFCKVVLLRTALEECGVRRFLNEADLGVFNEARFDKLHKKWCRFVIVSLRRNGISSCTFGRAAKLIAIYIKSVVVLGNRANTAFAHVAHPPIDRILLKGLAVSNVDSKHRRSWAKINWTQLDEQDYFKLIAQLREISHGQPLWMIERFWTVTNYDE